MPLLCLQVVLLQESWRELFVLSLAQTLLPVEVEPLLALAGAAASHQTAELMLPLLKEVGQLREVVARLRALRVDPTEYMCLKWIVLFKTGACRRERGPQSDITFIPWYIYGERMILFVKPGQSINYSKNRCSEEFGDGSQHSAVRQHTPIRIPIWCNNN